MAGIVAALEFNKGSGGGRGSQRAASFPLSDPHFTKVSARVIPSTILVDRCHIIGDEEKLNVFRRSRSCKCGMWGPLHLIGFLYYTCVAIELGDLGCRRGNVDEILRTAYHI